MVSYDYSSLKTLSCTGLDALLLTAFIIYIFAPDRQCLTEQARFKYGLLTLFLLKDRL